MLQVICPFLKLLRTEINDLYKWRPTTDGGARVIVSLTTIQHITGLMYTPLIKRIPPLAALPSSPPLMTRGRYIPLIKRIVQTVAHVRQLSRSPDLWVVP